MKKLLLPLFISFVLVANVYGQAANAFYGTTAGAGGALFYESDGLTGLNSISLGYFAGGDTSTAFIGLDSYTYGGAPFPAGFLNASASLTGVPTGEQAYLQLGDTNSTSFVSNATWIFAGTNPPAAPLTWDISMGASTVAADLELINVIATDNAGFQGSGVSIVVPEPSTYALLAGFAAFLFVAIRRRK